MTLFQQMVFKIHKILLIGVQAAFALQIEAPQEIYEAVSAYSKEAGAENRNAILRIGTIKNEHCDAFAIKLISSSDGKTINKIERCITELPNAALQNGIFEIFGHPVKGGEAVSSGNIKTVLIGTIFAASGLLLYYSNPPKPVYKEAAQ